jgi:hypothetical protein
LPRQPHRHLLCLGGAFTLQRPGRMRKRHGASRHQGSHLPQRLPIRHQVASRAAAHDLGSLHPGQFCETWVPLGPHKPGSWPSATSGSGLPEDPPTYQWAQPT